MLEVLGKNYYIDVDALISKCRPETRKKTKKENDGDDGDQQLELNVFKYETYKSCVDRVLAEYADDEDQDVTAFTNKTQSTSFGLAFNTLLQNKIIKENE